MQRSMFQTEHGEWRGGGEERGGEGGRRGRMEWGEGSEEELNCWEQQLG